MQPVLIVDGKEHKVREVNYNDNGDISYVGIFRESGVYTHYFDKDAECYIEKALRVNMKEDLKWVDRYTEVFEAIELEITKKSEELTELAIENIETEQPFTPSKLRDEYFTKRNETMGLIDALSIIEEFID